MKRNAHQMNDNKHGMPDHIIGDAESINAICELYDKGVTLDMVRLIFDEIQKERKEDLMGDTRDFELYRL